MRFVVVNQRPPCSASACSACARPLTFGYIRHVPTQQRYCDYDCYCQCQLATRSMPSWSTSWLDAPRASDGVALACRNAIEVIALMGAVSCWSYTTQMWALSRSL